MLKIRLVRAGDPSETPLDERVFDGGRLTIGRGANAIWRIEDPNKTISKTHCEVYNRGQEVFAVDHSTNGTFLNGAPDRMAKSESYGIAIGDRMRIGEYLLLFKEHQADASLDDFFGAKSGGGAIPPGFADDLLGTKRDISDGISSQERPGSIDDFLAGPDPFASGNKKHKEDFPEPPRGRGNLSSAFSDPILAPVNSAANAGAIPESWDIASDPLPKPKPPPSPPPSDSAPAGKSALNQIIPPLDFLDEGAREVQKSSRPVVPEDLSLEPMAEKMVSRPAAPVISDLEPSTGALAAFFEGAELDPAAFEGDDPAMIMRRAGAVYKQSVLNFSDILRDRSFLKNEFRLERTLIGAEQNNPLKFCDAHEAAIKLLRTPERGFIESDLAIREAGQDIKKHQIAVLSGLRIALQALLDRFRPSAILKDVGEDKSALGVLQGKSRQSQKAWEKFSLLHSTCEDEASTTTDNFLNHAFRRGYEEQIDKMDE